MTNRRTQDQQQPGKRNPGTFPPDPEDVGQDEDANAADQTQKGGQRDGERSAQQNRSAEADDGTLDDDADIDDEDDIDEDEEDGSGGHV